MSLPNTQPSGRSVTGHFSTLAQRALSGTGLRALGVGGLVAGVCLMAATGGAQADDVAKPVQVAADSAPSGNSIDDVTVTARRRKENLQDVPVAISVLNGDALSDNGIERLQQFQFEVPATSINLYNPRNTQTAIRGLGSNPASNGLASSVGLYVDDVYLDRPGMGTYDLFDLDQTEVLRGPQGTLFGKNTTAGAVAFHTAPPSFTPSASVETTFGNYGTQEYKAVLNGPIGTSDKLAARLSVYSDQHDGYVNNIAGPPTDDLNRQGVRAQLLFKPNDAFDVIWRNNWNVESDHAGAGILYSLVPPAAGSTAVNFSTLAQHLGVNPVVDPSGYHSDANIPQHMFTRLYDSSAEANWNLDNGGTVTSISAFRSYQFRPYNDSVAMLAPGNDTTVNTYATQSIEEEKELTQEVRYASPTGEAVDYVVGAYYLWRRETTSQHVDYPLGWSSTFGSTYSAGAWTNGAAWQNGALTITNSDPTTNSTALFGQSNWHVDDRLTATVGLRETFEQNTVSVTQLNPTGPYVSTMTNAQKSQYDYYHFSDARYDLNLAELATLSYKAYDHVNTYISFSHGAKAGGFNNAASGYAAGSGFQPPQTMEVVPEKVDSGEIGVKSQIPAYHVTFNADAFLTRVFDYQANDSYRLPNGSITTLLTNVGGVTSKGFEIDGNWRPSFVPGLRLGANGAYDLATYLSYRSVLLPANLQVGNNKTEDLTGQAVVGAPRWTGNLNAYYARSVNDDISAYVGGEYAYKSGQWGYYTNTPGSWLPAYGIANFRVGANLYESYDISVFVNNAFGTSAFYSTSYGGLGGAGYYMAYPLEPRLFGVTLRAKW